MAGRLDEPVPVFPKSVPLEHPQHIGARAYNDGDARQERRTYVERQDLVLGRVGERPFFSWNGVEFGDEDPEDPKAPEVIRIRERPGYPPHQQQPCKLDRRGPGFGAAFCFIVNQFLTSKRGIAMRCEGSAAVTGG